jgi:hypothetical protein
VTFLCCLDHKWVIGDIVQYQVIVDMPNLRQFAFAGCINENRISVVFWQELYNAEQQICIPGLSQWSPLFWPRSVQCGARILI